MKAHLILDNAQVLAMDSAKPRGPSPGGVAVGGNRILAVGAAKEIAQLRGPKTEVIDCQGKTLIPGFVDAHIHLLRFALSLVAVDCSPIQVGSIYEICATIAQRAKKTPPGQWIRAYGYHEFYLAEGRHPTRHDLDAASPNHPVWLNHQSGHASVLNSLALRMASIDSTTEEPPGGYMERDFDGEPTGFFLEMEDFLSVRLGHPSQGRRREEELAQAMGMASEWLLAHGVTSVQDAGRTNGPKEWSLFQRLRQGGHLKPRLSLMTSFDSLAAWEEMGLSYGRGDAWQRLGPVKVQLNYGGGFRPALAEMAEMMAQAQAKGFAMAIHAILDEEVQAAATVLQARALRQAQGTALRHRIEHASEVSPRGLELVRHSGALVVTQPGFIYHNGDRYLATVAPERQGWLYRLGSMLRAGVAVAFSSDAPVVPPEPLMAVRAAAARRTWRGQTLLAEEAIGVEEALALHTRAAAAAGGEEAEKGSIAPGKLADLVLLSGEPQAEETTVEMTILGGQVVWPKH